MDRGRWDAGSLGSHQDPLMVERHGAAGPDGDIEHAWPDDSRPADQRALSLPTPPPPPGPT